MKNIILMGLILLSCYSQATFAVDITKLNPIEVLTVKSKYFKTPLTYNVTLPKSYYEDSGKNKQYFVFFDLHPRSQPYLSGIHDWLSHNGDWPWLESIIVTPAIYHAEFAQLFEHIVTNPKDHTMLDYFERDLLATIDNKYRTNGFRIYSGFMSNGALGLYALLNRPNLFNAYIITSPSLANDFAAITSEAKTKLAKLDDKMRFLYLATGNHQYEKGNLPSFALFEKALKTSAPKSLDWQTHHNHQNNYMSQPIVSVINGIEALFGDIQQAIKYQTIAVEKSKTMIEWHQKKQKQYLTEYQSLQNKEKG